MKSQQEFIWEEFISLVNCMCYQKRTQLTKLDLVLLRSYWDGLSDRQIFEILEQNRNELKYYYSRDHYFQTGIEYNLMRKMSKLIGTPVNRHSFRKVFEQKFRDDFNQDRSA